MFQFKAGIQRCRISFHYWYPNKRRPFSIHETHVWARKMGIKCNRSCEIHSI